MNFSTTRIGKLDAARRQLRTAITLWFNGDDPVSVYTLAFAAYEIFHMVSVKRDPHRRELFFDTSIIKDEYRREWNAHVRREANFFKHGDRDPEAMIDFNPELSQWFIFFSILGRDLCGESASDEESAFLWWINVHRPDLLVEKKRNLLADCVQIETLDHLRALSKSEFFEAFCNAKRSIAARGHSFPSA